MRGREILQTRKNPQPGPGVLTSFPMYANHLSLTPPTPSRAPLQRLSDSDALSMLPEQPGYIMARDFSQHLTDAGEIDAASQLAGVLASWCHQCNTPAHPCPTPQHLRFRPEGSLATQSVYVRCKRSACPHCGPIYVKTWRQHIEDDLQFWLALGPRFKVYWFTQTWDPATEPLPFDEEASHKRLTVLFRDLVRYFRRNRPHGMFEYMTVIEPHQSGQIHMHAFIVIEGDELRPRCTAQHRGGYNRHRAPADRLPEGACVCTHTKNRDPCIQHIAREMGYGINNLQRLTTSAAASKYVTKRLGSYITKTVTSHTRPRYARALRMSRGFGVETHGAYKQRIADAHIARLTQLGTITERGPGTWEHRGKYAGRRWRYPSDESTAETLPAFEAEFEYRETVRQARPPPPPPCIANQLTL